MPISTRRRSPATIRSCSITEGPVAVVGTGLLAGALASLLALGLLVALPQLAEAAAADSEPAAVNVSILPGSEFWPAPEDGGEKLTVTFTAPAAGLYEIRFWGDPDVTFHDFGALQPGTYTYAWDGRTRKGDLFDRQNINVEIWSWREDSHWAEEIIIPVKLRRSFESDWVSDNTGENGAGHVDLDTWTLTTDKRGVHVRYDFVPGYRKAALVSLTAALDVDKLRRGYLATVRRKRSKLVPSLSLAVLASDVGRPERVRCHGMKVIHEKRALTLRIPRACLRQGGNSVRGNGWAFDSHGHYDGFPDAGDDFYFSDWVRYDPRP